MKWILLWVLYSHTPGDRGYKMTPSVSTTIGQMELDDEATCEMWKRAILNGAFSRKFTNNGTSDYVDDSTVTADAVCGPKAATNGHGPLKQ